MNRSLSHMMRKFLIIMKPVSYLFENNTDFANRETYPPTGCGKAATTYFLILWEDLWIYKITLRIITSSGSYYGSSPR